MLSTTFPQLCFLGSYVVKARKGAFPLGDFYCEQHITRGDTQRIHSHRRRSTHALPQDVGVYVQSTVSCNRRWHQKTAGGAGACPACSTSRCLASWRHSS